MDFDNLERMIIDNQKSINRLLSAIQTLKEQQDKGDKELKESLDYLSDSKIKEILKESSEDICLYTIKEGEWYFNNKPTGIKAIGKDGKDGHDGKDGKDGKNGLPGKDGHDGKDGKDGKNGLPGKDGKNGLNGLPGKDGKNGKDVDLRIGKVETSEDDEAHAKIRKEGNVDYLDLKLPKGPQGYMGFDGKNGKDATINGYNDITVEAGKNIEIKQEKNKLILNSNVNGNELYNDTVGEINTYYSFTGVKTLEGIKVPFGLHYITIIDALIFVLDYEHKAFIEAYQYAKDNIFKMVIPYDVYIDEAHSQYITIDLFNKGKGIIKISNNNGELSCTKLIVINYQTGWAIECLPDSINVLTDTRPTKVSELVNDSGFITNLAKDLVNYYKKDEVYNKEEINQLASTLQNVSITIVDTLPNIGKTNVIYFVSKTGKENDIYDEWIYINNKWEHIGSTQVDLTGYATEKWVKDQEYMPVPDFMEYINYFYYDTSEIDELLDDFYNKEEIDAMLEELPTGGGTALTGGDNTVIEDNAINVYTNTGYKVIDKDIQLQSITDSGTTGTTKMVYIDDKEIIILYDGTNKIRRSENGIDFDIVSLPYACKSMVYNKNSKKLFGLATGWFLISEDYGKTWTSKRNSVANKTDYITLGQAHIDGFVAVNKSSKRLTSMNEDGTSNTYISSKISPDFVTQFEAYRHIWCDVNGTFKYGAGSNEGEFASISNVIVNMLKTVNSIQIVGLKNNNKIYTIKNLTGTTDNEWVAHSMPTQCTVNDVIFSPYDETYYIFTDINTYYKTKDFSKFEPVDKNGLRGIQGYFTLEGIQTITSNHNELLLAPTRTKLENKLQEHDRALNKSLWVGDGLELTEEDKINIKINGDALSVSDYGIYLKQIDEQHLTENMIEALYVAKAEEKDLFDPYELENWFYDDDAYPQDSVYKAVKFLFNQAGNFYDQITWETEYVVEQYEYGYLFYDNNMQIFKYVKLGNKSWMFNKGE